MQYIKLYIYYNIFNIKTIVNKEIGILKKKTIKTMKIKKNKTHKNKQ